METKASLVLFDLSITVSVSPDGGMTTLRLEKYRTENSEIREIGTYRHVGTCSLVIFCYLAGSFA